MTPEKVMRSESQSKLQLRERVVVLEKLLSTLQTQVDQHTHTIMQTKVFMH